MFCAVCRCIIRVARVGSGVIARAEEGSAPSSTWCTAPYHEHGDWWVTLVVWNFNYHWIQFHENIYFTIDYWLCFRYADADKNKHAFYCSETILNIIRMMAEDNLNNLTNSFSFHGSVQSVWGLPAHTNKNIRCPDTVSIHREESDDATRDNIISLAVMMQ